MKGALLWQGPFAYAGLQTGRGWGDAGFMDPRPPSPESERPVSLAGHLLYAMWLTLLAAVPLLAAAWTLAWREGWIFLGLLLGEHVLQALVLWRRNPALVRHRLRRKPDVAVWDRRWMVLHGINGLALLILPGLERQMQGLQAMDAWVWGLAAACHVGGAALTSWAMASNPHFEGGVRHQEDRGQRVVETGPYGLVRHPGYTGFLLLVLPVPLLLGSRWALLPALMILPLLVWRIRREDAYLVASLEGYGAYATRVRGRLFPGVW